MKKTIHYLVFSTMIIGLLFTSCVSSKKFVASQDQVQNLKKDSINKSIQLDECYNQVENLKNEKASLLDDKESLQNKNIAGENNLKTLSDESKLTIEAQAKRLEDLQNIIQTQSNVMYNLKNSISEALVNYQADELSIYLEDGKVYVSLQEKLLFNSGSDNVDPKGKEALKTLAKVLNATKNINIVIEGHTDDVPIKTKQYKDNWDLSTARATTIVRILTIDNGLDEKRITASGKSQFHPVQTNKTKEGRAVNRRTEVVLSPDLNELYKILNQ